MSKSWPAIWNFYSLPLQNSELGISGSPEDPGPTDWSKKEGWALGNLLSQLFLQHHCTVSAIVVSWLLTIGQCQSRQGRAITIKLHTCARILAPDTTDTCAQIVLQLVTSVAASLCQCQTKMAKKEIKIYCSIMLMSLHIDELSPTAYLHYSFWHSKSILFVHIFKKPCDAERQKNSSPNIGCPASYINPAENDINVKHL